MTTPSKIEREGGVPEWAVKRACELTNLDGSTYSPETIERQGVLCTSIGLAFARYIAEHEEEPVDPLYEALFAVVELGRYDTREQTELLRGELAKRGLKIVECGK